MSILYIVWVLLPLTFFLLALWAVTKPWFGFHGREDTKHYFVQGVYCSIGLLLAIVIDSSSWFGQAVQIGGMGLLDISVARWLLYPSILVAAAYFQRVINKEEKKRQLPTQFNFR